VSPCSAPWCGLCGLLPRGCVAVLGGAAGAPAGVLCAESVAGVAAAVGGGDGAGVG